MESFYHFSHEHQLELAKSLPPKENTSCSGCNLKILSERDYYSCKACPFLLHRVCYNMPKRTQHSAHPNHYLSLHPKPSPSIKTPQCMACGGHIIGFHYTCAECGLYYHALCSALPLSISVSLHTHKLKLTFSAPYDFCCDVCNKPCYKIGWLYRCQICEYDTHLFCAIFNRKGPGSHQHQIAPFPTSTTRPHSSRRLMGINRSIDCTSEMDELIELVTRGGVGHQGHNLRSVGPSPSSNSAPFSEDLNTSTPSYQFSEACFSIDLDRSYSNYDHRTNPAKSQANNIDQVSKNTSSYGPYGSNSATLMPNPIILSESQPKKQPVPASNGNGQSNIYPLKTGHAEVHRLNQPYMIRCVSALPLMDGLDQNEKKIKETTSDQKKGKATKSYRVSRLLQFDLIFYLMHMHMHMHSFFFFLLFPFMHVVTNKVETL